MLFYVALVMFWFPHHHVNATVQVNFASPPFAGGADGHSSTRSVQPDDIDLYICFLLLCSCTCRTAPSVALGYAWPASRGLFWQHRRRIAVYLIIYLSSLKYLAVVAQQWLTALRFTVISCVGSSDPRDCPCYESVIRLNVGATCEFC